MKRSLSALFCLAMVLSLLALPASAVEAGSTDPNVAARFLNDLGLFQGTGSGFELGRSPTRAEAVTLLVRLLGKEAEAQAGTWTTPFTDVADWARPYVGCAYELGLTTGTGDQTFGSADPVDANQFSAFLLRALGYTDGEDFTWDSAAAYGRERGLPDVGSGFTRGSAALLSRAALDLKQKDSDATLADALISQGAFTAQALSDARAREHTPVPDEIITKTFTIYGVSFTLDLPAHWVEWCQFDVEDDVLFIRYAPDANNYWGGRIVAIKCVGDPDEYWQYVELLKLSNGRYLVYDNPGEITWSFQNPVTDKRCTQLRKEVHEVCSTLRLVP